MKKLLFLLAMLTTMLSSSFTISENASSAEYINAQKPNLDLPEGYRLPTSQELNYMVVKKWLSQEEDPEYLINCGWTDGFGGGMDCSGGSCYVVVRQDGYDAMIVCNIGGSLSTCCNRLL